MVKFLDIPRFQPIVEDFLVGNEDKLLYLKGLIWNHIKKRAREAVGVKASAKASLTLFFVKIGWYLLVIPYYKFLKNKSKGRRFTKETKQSIKYIFKAQDLTTLKSRAEKMEGRIKF